MTESKTTLLNQKARKLSELSAKKQEIKALTAEIESLQKERKKRIQNELLRVQTEVRDLEKEISGLVSEIASGKRELEDLRASLKKNEDQYETSREAIISASDDRQQNIQTAIYDLQRRKADLQAKKQQLEADLAKTFALSFGKKKNLRTQIEAISSEIYAAESDEQKKKTELSDEEANKSRRLIAIDSEVFDLKEKIKSLEDDISSSSENL